MAAPLHDLLTFDRDIARAWDAHARWRVALAADPDKNADIDPLLAYRHTSGQKAYDALREQPIAEPLKRALLAWVHALTVARVTADLDVDWARTCAESAAHFRLGAWGASRCIRHRGMAAQNSRYLNRSRSRRGETGRPETSYRNQEGGSATLSNATLPTSRKIPWHRAA